jgi:hypothetical protein
MLLVCETLSTFSVTFIIFFFIIYFLFTAVEFDEPEALIVLLEEELMAIDLLSDDWRMLSLPYLVSLHASAVTYSQHVSGVPRDLWNSIVSAGKRQTQDIYSDRVSAVTNFKLSIAQTSYKVVCMKYVTVRILYNVSII